MVVCANGAETPRLLLMSANAQFPHGLANSSGLVGKYLMFNYTSRALGVFEHELNEYKSVQVTRIVHDFYDSDPKRGHYGGGGLDARIGPQPDDVGDSHRHRGPVVGQRLQGAAEGVPPQHAGRLSRHVARRRVQQRHARSRPEGRVGPPGDPGRPTRIIPTISPTRDSCRIAAPRSSRRRARCGSPKPR